VSRLDEQERQFVERDLGRQVIPRGGEFRAEIDDAVEDGLVGADGEGGGEDLRIQNVHHVFLPAGADQWVCRDLGQAVCQRTNVMKSVVSAREWRRGLTFRIDRLTGRIGLGEMSSASRNWSRGRSGEL
jgi:hypothetical protein